MPALTSVFRYAMTAVGAMLLSLTASAQAQQTINVTFVSGYPSPTTWVGAFNGYAAAVDKELAKSGKFKINWNFAHSGQIVKPRGELEALESGVADIAAVVTPFHADRVPIYQLPFVTPFTTNDPALLSKIYLKLEEKYGQYMGWDKANQKVLSITAVVDNYFIASTKPLKSMSDLKGMKVTGAGPNLLWVTPLGAAAVPGTAGDFFNTLNTGVAGAVIAWPQALGGFKLCQPAPYVLDPIFGANSQVHLNVNTAFFNKLPDEVQKAFVAAGPSYNEANLSLLTEGAKKAMEECRTQHKLQVVTLDQAERIQWAKLLPNAAQDLAARMEQRGIPGREVLKFYMDEMRAANQPIARHWDRE